MDQPPLTGAQKSRLRSLGQKLDAALKVGKGGLGPGFYPHLQNALQRAELVKVRFLDADRHERAAWCETIAAEGGCLWVGAVGATALFFRAHPLPPEPPPEPARIIRAAASAASSFRPRTGKSVRKNAGVRPHRRSSP